jgi:hypothetical protein
MAGMIDPEIVGLVYLAIKAATSGRAEHNTKRVLSAIDRLTERQERFERRQQAFAAHMGVAFDERSDRVIVLRKPNGLTEYQDEAAKA